MQDTIEFNNANANRIMEFILSSVSNDDNVRISIEDKDAFYKIFLKERHNTKCPFSLWISFGNGDRLFFNLGNKEQEATVFHHWDITSNEAVEEVIDFLKNFLFSEIQETKMFCKGKLKLVEYELKGKEGLPVYSHVAETHFFCFNKRREVKLYEQWIK